ncbi:MAG: hypothetical protein HY326_07130 [Chloroflexi bacterium]|nr:hypothetical protein [Chloroflexota bacterium]
MERWRWVQRSFVLVVLLAVATSSPAVAQGPGRPAGPQASLAGNYNPQYDVNHDGSVTVQDLQLVAGAWLSSGSPTIIGQGPDYGGIFTATNSSGIGVRATGNTGSGIDLLGPAGVWGDTNNGEGVFGTTNTGHGVYGWAAGQSGVNTGVYGQSNSPAGVGTIGENVAGGVGVKGLSSGSGNGVLGTSFTGIGVRGQHANGSGLGTYIGGVVGDSNNSGFGVVGLSSGAPGVRGTSDTSTGVEAVSTSGSGVTGLSTSGIGVNGTSSSNHGVSATSSGTGTAGAALAATANGSSGIAIYGVSTSSDATLVIANKGSGDLIRAFGTNTAGNLRFQVDQAGNVKADGTYTSPAADFAELLPAAEELVPGEVLAIAPDGRLSRSTQAYQTTVAGVFSSQPAFLGGFEEGNQGKVPLAVVGVVPVKVSAENGAVQAGDLLVTSATPGYAMRCEERVKCIGAIIGKALGQLDKGLGIIQVLITLQ